ncbi:MAG: molybdopterin-dependent oxidoreductase [Anaerolineae bacterium]|nr:molybdopterin-dependent oxidoreductase [Anaerolineae bacterium]
MKKKPTILTGALIGGLLSLPLMALSFLGSVLIGLPFFPAFVFAFLRDRTPGEIVPRIVGVMSSSIISLNIGRVDTVAKTVEEIISLLTVFGIGLVAGAIIFAILNAALKHGSPLLTGIIAGAAFGLVMTLIQASYPGLFLADMAFMVIWTFALFMLYGLALSYIYHTLRFSIGAAAETADDTSASVESLDRRQFLIRVGTGAAVITAVGAGVGALLSRTDQIVSTAAAPTLTPDAMPEALATSTPAQRMAGGEFIPASGTRPEITPVAEHYRIDISTIIPQIPAEGYILPFTSRISADGVERTIAELTLDQIRSNYEPISAVVTMSCISNDVGGDLISTLEWTGARMSDILTGMEIPAEATHLRITAADGFDEFVSLEMINSDERIMLAYDWGGEPLIPKHGFPLRIHIPNHYGMKQPKWITGMAFVAADTGGYWVRRGWDAQAIAKATSVIDTAAVDDRFQDESGQIYVPIGGIAWAGDRGVSRVQVRVDEGDWADAALKAPLSDRAWILWRYDFPFTEGNHDLEVRCEESDGTPQIEQQAGTFPDGASGYDWKRVAV